MQKTIEAKQTLDLPLTTQETAFFILYMATDEEVAQFIDNKNGENKLCQDLQN